MSNYPPTPAFGGGFPMSRPPFPGPKPNGSFKPQVQQTVPPPPYATRFPGPSESVSNLGLQHTKNNNTLEVPEGDREEGEVSDVEMENGRLPPGKSDLQSTAQLNGRLNKNINISGKFVDKSHETLLGSVDPRKAKTLTAQISALNIREQACVVNNSSTSPVFPSHGNNQLGQYQPVDQRYVQNPAPVGPPSAGEGNPYGNTSFAAITPYTPQQMEDMRKRAQTAVLNLLPVKLTFKDIVNEGVDPSVLRQVYERIGLPIPTEDVLPPMADSRHDTQAEAARLKRSQQEREKEMEEAKEKEREREEQKEKEKKEKEREATRLILQEKLRKQEQILKEQEQRKRDAEKRMKEELEKKEQEEREQELREEAIAATKKKMEEEEERLRAEAVRKKREEELKRRIVQQKFEEMRLPAKPPLPSLPTPPLSSLPPRVSTASSLPPPPFTTSTPPSAPMMIPGLLLDTMDMGPRAPETPMVGPIVTDTPIAPTQALASTNVISQPEDSVMKDAPENRSFTRKKRPVAADFDTEPSTKFQQPKRRFGSLKEGAFIFELTEDEDEDTEVDEPYTFGSQRLQGTRIPPQSSKSPPVVNGGGIKLPERNGKSPPARTSSAANGTTDAARQLQDTEEEIRRLREEIRARQEKKRKPSASATPTGTSTPVRVATPLEIPGLGTNSSLLVPPTQLPVPSPLKVSQSEKPTQKIPGLGAQDNDPLISDPTTTTASINGEVNQSVEVTQPTITDASTVAAQELETVGSSIPPGLASSITQQKAEDESKSQRMREEAERLKLLLLSKRKATEVRQVPTPDTATSRHIPESSDHTTIPNAQKDISKIIVEEPITNNVINDNESDSSVTEQVAKCTLGQPIEHQIPEIADELPSYEESQTIGHDHGISVPSLESPKVGLCLSPQAMDHPMDHPMEAEIAREKSESPPYEPSLDNHRHCTESPPYEPSLGPDDGTAQEFEDKMEIDESGSEEGEILEESVDMEVDSGEDEVIEDNVLTAVTSSRDDASEGHAAVNRTQAQDKDHPVYDTPLSSRAAAPVPIAQEPPPEEQSKNSISGTVADDRRNVSLISLVSGTKVMPNVFTAYESPLREFHSFRYHPQYLRMVKGGWRSLTFSNRIDPDKVFCVYEISGGKCNDPTCTNQHFRQTVLSDDEILVELGSVMEGDTDAIRNSYREGLRELITSMRARKVNDFETVAAEISLYRSKFFNDPSRVVRLTKEP